MFEGWTYTLSDIVLFSPRVYFRLLELRAQALWPAPLLTLAFGGGILLGALRPRPALTRLMLAGLAGLWLWLAWSFFWIDYAAINWAAAYAAPVVAAQGLLLLAAAGASALRFAPPRGPASWALLGVLGGAVLGYPALALLAGRPWGAAEVFGIVPDPTALATLALLALAAGRLRWLLMLIPALGCVLAGLTLWALKAPDFFVAPTAALLAIAAAFSRRPG